MSGIPPCGLLLCVEVSRGGPSALVRGTPPFLRAAKTRGGKGPSLTGNAQTMVVTGQGIICRDL